MSQEPVLLNFQYGISQIINKSILTGNNHNIKPKKIPRNKNYLTFHYSNGCLNNIKALAIFRNIEMINSI
jgi:hypothetical protein